MANPNDTSSQIYFEYPILTSQDIRRFLFDHPLLVQTQICKTQGQPLLGEFEKGRSFFIAKLSQAIVPARLSVPILSLQGQPPG